ncbi:MAG: glycosyltransferase family 2 protein [Chromatiaceae bacterium]|nr:glycosyltransferase family 2 protein [Chromatiaceae bacterium]
MVTISPAVSLIIPHWNRARLLAETLDSIRAQTMSNWEVVIVDDGSAANEIQLLKTYVEDRIRLLVRHDEPKGPSRCRNLGWRAARAPYLIFLDSDDLLAPWCLEERLKLALGRPPQNFMIFSVMLFRDQPGDTAELWNDPGAKPHLERFLCSDGPWHTSSGLWTRAGLDRIGGFNERVIYGDDADLHIRALLAQVPYMVEADALPDLFVRRSEQPRITNSVSESLLKSRQVRLEEGTRALRAATASNRLMQIWEGQYFFEIEFLLFNVDQAGLWIKPLLQAWQHHLPPRRWQYAVVVAYAAIVQSCRHKAYFIVRVARRVIQAVLPDTYFPRMDTNGNRRLEQPQMERLRVKLTERMGV